MKTEEGKLLLSQLDSHPHHPAVVNWTSFASGVKTLSTGNQEFNSTVFFDEFTFLELTEVTGNYTVCQKALCCHLSYKMSEKRSINKWLEHPTQWVIPVALKWWYRKPLKIHRYTCSLAVKISNVTCIVPNQFLNISFERVLMLIFLFHTWVYTFREREKTI